MSNATNKISGNRRIAKNTFFLYLRMLLLIFITFYSTKIILIALGVDDFGLYNVIAGFVSMAAFLNTSLSNSIQRFLNFELGKGENNDFEKVFSISLLSQIIVSIFVILLAETIGLWLLNTQMSIPQNRIMAANIVYQFSVVSLIVKILQAPYNAVIVAYEKMQFYAYITLIEVLLQLGIAYIMLIDLNNKLEWYSFGMFFIIVITFIWCIIYSKKIHTLLEFKLTFDKQIFNKLYSFSGWNLLGSASGVLMHQGINVIINIFFNVAINAARGLSFQVIAGVQRFISSFQLAINPQIVQSFASGDKTRYLTLCYANFKISFYLMWIIALPLLLSCEHVLELWLDIVPDYTIEFVKVSLIWGMVEALGSSVSVPMNATGNIKKYQIVISLIKVTSLPITVLVFQMGFAPIWSLYICVFIDLIAQYFRIKIWTFEVGDSIIHYAKSIIIPGIVILISSYFLCNFISRNVLTDNPILSILYSIIITLPINLGLLFFIGFNYSERNIILEKFKWKITCRRKL